MAGEFEKAIETIRRGGSITRDETLALTAEQRLALVWELTKIEWGVTDDTPMRRDVVRVIRPGKPVD